MKPRVIATILYGFGAGIFGAFFLLIAISKLTSGDWYAYFLLLVSGVACVLCGREARRGSLR